MSELGIPLASGSNQNTQPSKKLLSPLSVYYIFLADMFIIGIYFLYDAIQVYATGDLEGAAFSSILGIIGTGMSIYMLTTLRKRVTTQKLPKKVVTTVECNKCGLKKLRPFMKGDYILKDGETCVKCNEPMLITAIYTEKRDKS